MKIVHVNTYLHGGAARAVIRLHEALLESGVDSYLIFLKGKANNIPNAQAYNVNQSLIKRIGKKLNYFSIPEKTQNEENIRTLNHLHKIGEFDVFTFPLTDYRIDKIPQLKEADIINLHWVGDFLDWPTFFRKIKVPVVWTFHDRNPILGGLHLEADYHRNSNDFRKVDDYYLKLKKPIIDQFKDLTIVCPSLSLAQIVRKSNLFKDNKNVDVEVIANSVNEKVFKGFDPVKIKEELGLEKDDMLITYVGSLAYHKGFDIFLNAVNRFEKQNLKFLVIGINKKDVEFSISMDSIQFIGNINNDRKLARIYSASMAVVITSREDNLPNVMLEAWACGTPVLSVPVGGMQDSIKQGFNGIIAEKNDAESVRTMIQEFLKSRNEFSRKEISAYARKNYSPMLQANKYLDLYLDILR